MWLLFLPFIFINLAHWMLPPATSRRRRRGLGGPAATDRAVVHADVDARRRGSGDGRNGLAVYGFGLLRRDAGAAVVLGVTAPRGAQVALSAVPLVVVIAVLWRLGRENTRVTGRAAEPRE